MWYMNYLPCRSSCQCINSKMSNYTIEICQDAMRMEINNNLWSYFLNLLRHIHLCRVFCLKVLLAVHPNLCTVFQETFFSLKINWKSWVLPMCIKLWIMGIWLAHVFLSLVIVMNTFARLVVVLLLTLICFIVLCFINNIFRDMYVCLFNGLYFSNMFNCAAWIIV